ncbi:hypothetical protein BG841_11630 [Marinobacter sp. X15-166B]|nr:hypothetical protein BG841_11630 [Marinobacter sp. X15-166B]
MKSVWGRLLASFVLIGGILSIVTVLTLWQFAQVQKHISDLVQDHIPDITLANELASSANHLSNVATKLAEPRLKAVTDKQSLGYQPVLDNLRILIDRIDESANIEKHQLTEYQKEIAQALDLLSKLSARRQTLEATINRSINELRWLQSDFQSEIRPLLRDLSYNMDNSARQAVNATNEAERAQAASWLARDEKRRAIVQEIERDGAFAINTILQGATANDVKILNEFKDIAGETLDSLDHHLQVLGVLSELITLRQSILLLHGMVSGPGSVLEARLDYLIARDAALQSLVHLHGQIEGLQNALKDLGMEKRQTALAVADYSADETRRAGLRIMMLAVLGLVAVVAIMWFYVRNRITRRLKAISHAMQAIVRGETDVAALDAGGDEIGRMAHAIEVFRQSVVDRERNLQRLQVEIAQREEVVQELRRTQTELIQAGKLAALGQLSAGISHELIQPITAIQYAAQNARFKLARCDNDPGELRVTQANALGKIIRVSDRMAALVKQFSRFARRADFELKAVTLAAAVEGAIDLFRPQYNDKSGLVIRVDRASFEGIKVMGDLILIEQVLVNLISNARDSIRVSGTAEGEITISGSRKNGCFLVEITDNGAGLPDVSQSVFDPFVTTKETGEGTGLGLSISYNIAQDLKGFLTLKNEARGGVRATLGLKIIDKSTELVPRVAK